MAEEVFGTVRDAIKGVFENVNGSPNAEPKNETITSEKKVSTPEGIAVAYGSLVIMAMLPIIFGSIRSVKLHKLKKVSRIPAMRLPLFQYFQSTFPSVDGRESRYHDQKGCHVLPVDCLGGPLRSIHVLQNIPEGTH